MKCVSLYGFNVLYDLIKKALDPCTTDGPIRYAVFAAPIKQYDTASGDVWNFYLALWSRASGERKYSSVVQGRAPLGGLAYEVCPQKLKQFADTVY